MKNGIEEVFSFLTQQFADRVENMGEKESGAYNFYSSRIQRNTLLAIQERKLLTVIQENYSPDVSFIEVGAGVGTICMGLATLNYSATAIDADHARIAAAIFLQGALKERYPDIGARFNVVKARFGVDPIFEHGSAHGLRVGLCTNFINSWTAENQERVAECLSEFDEVILDVLRFGKLRTIAQKHEVLGYFKNYPHEQFLDLGGGGVYYRINFR